MVVPRKFISKILITFISFLLLHTKVLSEKPTIAAIEGCSETGSTNEHLKAGVALFQSRATPAEHTSLTRPIQLQPQATPPEHVVSIGTEANNRPLRSRESSSVSVHTNALSEPAIVSAVEACSETGSPEEHPNAGVSLFQSRATPAEHTSQLQPQATPAEQPVSIGTEPNHRQPGSTEASSVSAAREHNLIEPNIRDRPNDYIRLQWPLLILTIYINAVTIGLQDLQTSSNPKENIPARISFQYHFYRMSFLFSLAYFTISILVGHFSVEAGLILQQVAILFGAVASGLVLTIADFPLPVMIASLAIFAVSLVIVSLILAWHFGDEIMGKINRRLSRR